MQSLCLTLVVIVLLTIHILANSCSQINSTLTTECNNYCPDLCAVVGEVEKCDMENAIFIGDEKHPCPLLVTSACQYWCVERQKVKDNSFRIGIMLNNPSSTFPSSSNTYIKNIGPLTIPQEYSEV